MLEGYVTFPGRFRQDIEPLFETISTQRYDYPAFIQKRKRRNSLNYTIYGTIRPENVTTVVQVLSAFNRVVDAGIPYSIAFGIA
jgi:hypothetical protein